MTRVVGDRPKRNWVGLLLTTFLGIAATVGVGWYQLYQAEKQSILAEEERARAVRQSLVAIVEEHVLNDKPIDIPRLARLIDQRRREERVATPISVAALLENAEFNILGSRYLAFERKQALKAVFDTLYADLGTRAFAPYSPDTPNADLLNALARQLQDGKTAEALETLKRLQEAQGKDLAEARAAWRARPSLPKAMTELLNDPVPIVFTMVVYVLFFIWMARRRPELFRILRRLLAPHMSPTEVRRRISAYREDGLPDHLIVQELRDLGVPRAWALEQLRELGGETLEGQKEEKEAE